MTDSIRSAKSGSDWTEGDLAAYNIHLEEQFEPIDFFGVEVLPDSTVDAEILHELEASTMQSDANVEFAHLLDISMDPTSSEFSVDLFAVELFKRVGYFRRNRVPARKELRLTICGELRFAKMDVCIVDRDKNNIILLIQEDKRFQSKRSLSTDARAQLVAEALAAVAENNDREEGLDLSPLDTKVMPGIVMEGTSPTFFKIPVTRELLFHVSRGTFPPTPTIVNFYVPPTLRPPHAVMAGMKPLDNRREILRCYEAFKSIIGI